VPTSSYRGAGRPDIAYAIERLVDYACHEHGFDPVEMRRKNFIPVADFPYKTANGTSYDLCDFDRVMTLALSLADHAHYPERKAAASRAGKVRGLGLSTYVEASGAGTAQMDQVHGQMSESGVLTIEGLTGASGQGHQTSFAKIVHTELGMLEKDIRYGSAQTGTALQGNGTGGSRSLYGAGSAIKNMCSQLKDQIATLLASHWSCAPEAVRYEQGSWRQDGSQAHPPMSTTEVLARLTPQERVALQATGEAKSGSTFPNGCHVVEIEIDPETGETEIVNYTAVDELGRVISPHLVRGQVHGGVVQGLGQAFMEQVVYDEQGQLITGSFMDYAMPRAGDLKALNNATVELGTELNLLGAKGVGESGCTGSLPALANAMMEALRPFGVDRMDMPFTPEKVWRALRV
jgi:carbon-monoxide dehydrogenase large subunit